MGDRSPKGCGFLKFVKFQSNIPGAMCVLAMALQVADWPRFYFSQAAPARVKPCFIYYYQSDKGFLCDEIPAAIVEPKGRGCCLSLTKQFLLLLATIYYGITENVTDECCHNRDTPSPCSEILKAIYLKD